MQISEKVGQVHHVFPFLFATVMNIRLYCILDKFFLKRIMMLNITLTVPHALLFSKIRNDLFLSRYITDPIIFFL